MASMSQLATSKSDVHDFALDLIEIEDGFNWRDPTRELEADIAVIQASIMEIGFDRTQPIIVRRQPGADKFFVTEGHKRLTAAKRAQAAGLDLKSIPCIGEPKGTSAADRALIMFMSAQKAPFKPLEALRGIKIMMACGWTEVEIAKKIGRPVSYIEAALALGAAPAEIQNAVRADEISATTAVDMVRHEADPVAALERGRKARDDRGGDKVRPRDVAPRKPTPPLTMAVSALLDLWDGYMGRPLPNDIPELERAVEVVRAALVV